MMRQRSLFLIPAVLLVALIQICASRAAPHIKVEIVDHASGSIQVLLPMHNTRVMATLLSEAEALEAGVPYEPEIRVSAGEFYQGAIESGEVGTTKRNVLRVEIPQERPVRFRILQIIFLE
jgi:hypothetical protein